MRDFRVEVLVLNGEGHTVQGVGGRQQVTVPQRVADVVGLEVDHGCAGISIPDHDNDCTHDA